MYYLNSVSTKATTEPAKANTNDLINILENPKIPVAYPFCCPQAYFINSLDLLSLLLWIPNKILSRNLIGTVILRILNIFFNSHTTDCFKLNSSKYGQLTMKETLNLNLPSKQYQMLGQDWRLDHLRKLVIS